MNNENVKRKVRVKRGDLVLVDLGQGLGSEAQGSRPAVIVQNDVGNRNSSTTIILPLTKTPGKRLLPTHSFLYQTECGVAADSIVMAEHPRAISKTRITAKIGIATSAEMELIDNALMVSFGLE